MKIIIESITEWKRDDAETEGDLSHGSADSDFLRELAEETKAKKESEWTRGLPFTWEEDVELDVNGTVDVGRDIRPFLDDALAEYSDQYCHGDYLKPTAFEGRIVA